MSFGAPKAKNISAANSKTFKTAKTKKQPNPVFGKPSTSKAPKVVTPKPAMRKGVC